MSEAITSGQNAKLKLAAALKQKKYRDERGLFLAEGLRLCEEAAKSDYEAEFCIYSSPDREHERLKDLLRLLADKECPAYETPKRLYDKASDTKEPQGVLMVMKKRRFSPDALLNGSRMPLIAVLDGLQDPGNLGTIVRSADAAGCAGVVLLENTVDLFSPKAVRSTMGSLFHFPVVEQMKPEEAISFFRSHGIKIFATALDGRAKPYFQADFSQHAAVVFGNEGRGVQDAFFQQCDEKIFIPMAGGAESLNVATAAAIVIYEGLRQRMAK